ncbi:MAG: diadenosine tetraphosphate hydrolase [Rhizobiales bacterium 63-7]|uniref:HIT domain-containing protein n=1 Tax=Rhizobium sp. YJ-22 TaxID=3037556 RepID=UPI000926B88C|nr:HIT family protein [Rhizobium sp. YJ-22]MBN9033510.1 HIT domain-containing protein [Hyphomicrobiales bacterium]MDG3575590.1 HIT family protein [Rhizobium sp. YJ-22]OJU69852.1 MAG: diadenosine tetraphosphate hydrolase [Rhizobiales bacterium 63-7]
MQGFELDGRLARDSILLTELGLCQVRLQNERRWPWLVLVPQRNGMSEIFDLPPEDQAALLSETTRVAAALKSVTDATKINIGALGNIVRQLHVHVIARAEGDDNWPGPVWGFGKAEPYDDAIKDEFVSRLLKVLSA